MGFISRIIIVMACIRELRGPKQITHAPPSRAKDVGFGVKRLWFRLGFMGG